MNAAKSDANVVVDTYVTVSDKRGNFAHFNYFQYSQNKPTTTIFIFFFIASYESAASPPSLKPGKSLDISSVQVLASCQKKNARWTTCQLIYGGRAKFRGKVALVTILLVIMASPRAQAVADAANAIMRMESEKDMQAHVCAG